MSIDYVVICTLSTYFFKICSNFYTNVLLFPTGKGKDCLLSIFWDTALPIMAQLKISQNDIAVNIGKYRGTVNKWIIRDTLPPIDDAYKIAALLQVDLRYLVTGIQPDNYNDDLDFILKKPELKKIIDLIKYHNNEDLQKIRAAIEVCVALSATKDRANKKNAG